MRQATHETLPLLSFAEYMEIESHVGPVLQISLLGWELLLSQWSLVNDSILHSLEYYRADLGTEFGIHVV